MYMINFPPSFRWLQAASAALLLSVSVSTQAASAQWWNDIVNDRQDAVLRELAKGQDPNAQHEGQPAAMYAIQQDSWRVYDLLSQHRQFDWNQANTNNETVLMYLAIVGDQARVNTAIAQGAEVKRLGWTPLHYAASKGHTDIAQLLLQHGALVNAPAPDGTTPLMMAALSGSRDMVTVLIRAGADPRAENLQGLTAADWAENNNHSQLAQELNRLASGATQATTVKQPSASPESAPSATAPYSASKREADAPASEGSSSRYFDLERFN